MADFRPYPSDGENRPPRKHRHDQRSSRTETQERNSEYHNGAERRNHEERHRDRYHDDRGPRRPREDVGGGHHHERERPREDRGQHRDRGRDGHRERDQRHEDRGHSRTERSQHYYKDRGDQRSEKSQYQERQDDYYKERNHTRFDDGDRDSERYTHSPRGKIPEYYNPSERSFPHNGAQMDDMEYYEEPQGGILDCHQCKYLCTGRGILQMLEVILNALVLICIISSYFVLSGFSAGMASGGFGGGYYPFEGQELQQVRQLDQEFTLLRSPLLYGGLTVSLLMGTLTLAILAAGSKHLLRLSNRWLVIEATFSAVASLGYVAAVGVFLHFALQINATDTCKKRERLYARNGLTWMNCDLAGTDGGAAVFAIMLVILYGASTVLAIRAYKERKSLQQ